jgi:DNA-binding Xre family transcriptional regulator
MIRTYVRKTAEQNSITTAYQLQKALSISPSVAAKLWSDDFEFISRTSLNRLCILFNCQPSSLITFELANGDKEINRCIREKGKVSRPKKVVK